MSKLECPACGSNHITDSKITETRQLTLGTEFSYLVPIHKCESCGEEGDFSGQSEHVREKALDEARETLAKSLIQSISNSGLKLAYVERAFELPQRTLSSKWGTGKISASGLALLRVIKSMPWIVHIADHGFSPEVIKNTVHLVWESFLRERNFPVTYSASHGTTRNVHIHITDVGEQPNKLTGIIEVGQRAVPSA